jgi:DNA-binding NarL/FixJ family response regulator
MTTKVLIADDHPFLARSLAEAVAAMDGFAVAGVAANGIEAIALVRRLRPDCAVLDFAMPGANGIEVLTEIRRWSPTTRVLVVTGHHAHAALGEVLRAGAEGLMPKSAEPARILAALRAVAGGGRAVDAGLERAIRRRAEAPALSPREGEVLRAIARGQSNAEAAASLGLSAKTVDGHRTNLMRKLGVHSTARLMVVAVREGLFDPDEID